MSLSTTGPVLVVGSGLLGASAGLALSIGGVPVQLQDTSPSARALARDLGAGTLVDDVAPDDPTPTLVVVAVPPDVTSDVVARALRQHPDAVVTDVASVKAVILAELQEMVAAGGLSDAELARYVGSHPMAGRERSGAAAADADLFHSRPWVLVPHAGSDAGALARVRTLAIDLGSVPLQMGAQEHDDAVALVSHVPQVLSSLVAARLVEAPDGALALAGQGLRDVTRIAASDPRLWAAILVGNAAPVRDQLALVRDDLTALVAALDGAAQQGPLTPGAMAAASDAVRRGNAGVARVPGKHGGARRAYAEVTVLVPDSTGELGRLFATVGELGVNIEDVTMEHATQHRVGMTTLAVVPDAAERLTQGLDERGWRVVQA
ncbi:prephenate dehydrogenase [Litorihabitans aurantiacus]|uniref:Prephenate dehydrogenase n=1 Tax=Litorihabitans aurantiacus TaxID=1930061 RepID=A0AA37UVE2_9MICO|nr:prephenate dehydrogenase [Litorihabitans aurantiacus]GMA31191.1 prephenate dehydrogenase [Litorihabitans aurantiacus]